VIRLCYKIFKVAKQNLKERKIQHQLNKINLQKLKIGLFKINQKIFLKRQKK